MTLPMLSKDLQVTAGACIAFSAELSFAMACMHGAGLMTTTQTTQSSCSSCEKKVPKATWAVIWDSRSAAQLARRLSRVAAWPPDTTEAPGPPPHESWTSTCSQSIQGVCERCASCRDWWLQLLSCDILHELHSTGAVTKGTSRSSRLSAKTELLPCCQAREMVPLLSNRAYLYSRIWPAGSSTSAVH